MAKVEIVESDVIELSFRFRIYDIEEEFYGAQIWWKAGPVFEPTIDGWSDEAMMTFNGDDIIPEGVTECKSDTIFGYKWTENSDVTPDFGTSHFKVGLVYHFSFNYVKEGEFGVFNSLADVVIKDSASYDAELPLTIVQALPGSNSAYFECDFGGLFSGNYIDDFAYSTITIFRADGVVMAPEFYYEDIETALTVLERNGSVVKWEMLVGDTFNTPIGFYIQTQTHTRPINAEDGWDSIYATHSSSSSETVYVTLVDEDAPVCEILVTFRDANFASSGTRVTGTIKNCPIISASDWNQFCSDINAVRAKATKKGVNLPEWYFESVEGGVTEMGALLFKNVFDAVCDTCPSTVEVPQSNVDFEKGVDISGEALYILLGRLAVALRESRDCYWSFSDNT